MPNRWAELTSPGGAGFGVVNTRDSDIGWVVLDWLHDPAKIIDKTPAPSTADRKKPGIFVPFGPWASRPILGFRIPFSACRRQTMLDHTTIRHGH